ncbi:selenium cofactor biosynthesis protein YqeC [Clostridium sp. Marseille-P2415]|uniref:selenium cofactor biosynthesis protein YqeC n=1 Tax=Clostridium sp. Marseille-P2415 TaxID=1805471 RepID=UPI001F32B1DC|nr:selenium cofactor biosynthesis protein YqeC [Clostridium sp. Marseille-P2415]
MRAKNIYTWEDRKAGQVMAGRDSLWDALGLSWREHMVISFTGGGGKTSAMFSLADELADRGKHVIVTTSTHIFFPQNRRVVPADRAETVKKFIKDHAEWFSSGTGRVLVTGCPGPEGKLKGMPLSEMEKLAGCGDILLVEADGAKRLPIKIPREGEPVLLKNTHAVIGCAGLDSIGRPWEEKCFRWELAEKVFGWQTEKKLITPAQVAQLLVSGQGTRKGAESMEYRILLNKADDESRLSDAAKVLESMEAEWKRRCVVTSFFTI